MVAFIGPQLPSDVSLFEEGRQNSDGKLAEEEGEPEACASASLTPSLELPALSGRWLAEVDHGCGLKNLGNSCFLNSVLQCLAHVPPLANLCFAQHHRFSSAPDHLPGEKAMDMDCAYCLLERRLYKQLQRGQPEGATVPRSLHNRVGLLSKTLITGRQEDAHEFLRVLLEAVEQACLQALRGKSAPKDGQEPETIVRRLFGGLLQSQVRCCECNRVSRTRDPIFDISLDIGGCFTLDQALAKFARSERLEGANAYQCEHCKRLVTAEKQLLLLEAPNVLVVHLKRFDGSHSKVTSNVAFDERMSLRDFMAADSPDLAMGVAEPVYSLCGVLVHQGWSAHAGHYYAYVRGRGGRFMEMNDERVDRIPREQVLVAQAYMLFYVRDTLRQSEVGSAQKRRGEMCKGDLLPSKRRCGREGTPDVCVTDTSAGSSITRYDIAVPDSPRHTPHERQNQPPPTGCEPLDLGPASNGSNPAEPAPISDGGDAALYGNGALNVSHALDGNGAADLRDGALGTGGLSGGDGGVGNGNMMANGEALGDGSSTQPGSAVKQVPAKGAGENRPKREPGVPLEMQMDMVDRQQQAVLVPKPPANPAAANPIAQHLSNSREFREMNIKAASQPVKIAQPIGATKLMGKLATDATRPGISVNGRMALPKMPFGGGGNGRRMLAAQGRKNAEAAAVRAREASALGQGPASPQLPGWVLEHRPGMTSGVPSAGPLDVLPGRASAQHSNGVVHTFNRSQNRMTGA